MSKRQMEFPRGRRRRRRGHGDVARSISGASQQEAKNLVRGSAQPADASCEGGVGFRRRVSLSGLTGDERRSRVLQRHL